MLSVVIGASIGGFAGGALVRFGWGKRLKKRRERQRNSYNISKG